MFAQVAWGIGSLLFPTVCPGCRRSAERDGPAGLCPPCLERLPRCRPSWRAGHRPLDGAISPFLYEGVCRDLILALKYQGRTSLAPFLAGEMAEAVVLQLGAGPVDWILPVPLHPARLRERTFNQAELLARTLSHRTCFPCDSGLLVRTRPTRPQAGLNREERSGNVRGAFDLRDGSRLKGSRILLVDDVLTTGATAEACAALLKSAGARSVWAVTAARD